MMDMWSTIPTKGCVELLDSKSKHFDDGDDDDDDDDDNANNESMAVIAT
jgi:hypothetical protein